MNTGSYEQLMQQAWAASEANDAESAIRLWSEAARCQPPSAVPHLLLGAEHAQAGRITEAEASFANAILLSPSLLIARFQLGLLQFTSGRVGVALLTWQAILDADRDNALSLFVQGFAALAADAFSDALTAFETGIERNVDNEPLNQDIRMVMARTRELQATSLAGKMSVTIAERDASSSQSEEHILLANYQQYGLPH